KDELLPQITPLFSRFPFNRAAEREVSPSELDALNEATGAFWQDVKSFYADVLTERSGTYQQKSTSSGTLTLALPNDMLGTLSRLATLSRALFAPDGSRQPLKLSLRGLPGRQVQENLSTQFTTAFLQVGRAAAYGFNQQAAGIPLSV